MKIASILLAAGASRRMGSGLNKLLIEVDGIPLVRRLVDRIRRVVDGPMVVVTGHEARQVSAALDGISLHIVFNPKWESGMGSSLAVGARTLDGPREIGGLLVCLGDLPSLVSEDIGEVVSAFRRVGGERVTVPEFEGRRGHPVLFPWKFRDALSELKGDQGARGLIQASDPLVVETVGPGVCRDLDQPEDLEGFVWERGKGTR
jgi:molybdenum cofactor cytidylyltransferase